MVTNADGSGGALLSYSVYRGDGKRAWKQNAAGARTYFFYDGDTLIGTSGDLANSASVWLWGADGLIGTQTKNAAGAVTSGYYLYDAGGNLAQTVSGAGVVTPVAAYTAWGEVVPKADGTKPSLGSLGYGAKFGYWRDSDSGLYLCTLRFYDPANGRFVTRDPIGFAGGSNVFGYTGNDPSNASDPLGLITPEEVAKELILGAAGIETGPLGVLLGDQESLNPDEDANLANRYRLERLRRKPVNLPSWRTCKIDMEEVMSGHSAGGIRLNPGNRKTLFPDSMSARQIESAIRQAYRYGEKVKTQGDRVKIRGKSGGLNIEMWVNRATKEIETAYTIRP